MKYTVGGTTITITPFRLDGLPCQREVVTDPGYKKGQPRTIYRVRIEDLIDGERLHKDLLRLRRAHPTITDLITSTTLP